MAISLLSGRVYQGDCLISTVQLYGLQASFSTRFLPYWAFQASRCQQTLLVYGASSLFLEDFLSLHVWVLLEQVIKLSGHLYTAILSGVHFPTSYWGVNLTWYGQMHSCLFHREQRYYLLPYYCCCSSYAWYLHLHEGVLLQYPNYLVIS